MDDIIIDGYDAYIELDIDGQVKGYCYQGSIDLRSEGVCASWTNT